MGSLSRWGLGLVLGPWDGSGLPLATLLANLLGCLVIGVLAQLPGLAAGPSWLRPFLITGVLGGFTTFSALALEFGVLAQAGQVLIAGAYLVLTLAGGLTAVSIGRALVNSR